MNCCKPEQVGTEEHGKLLQRIQILEDGKVPAKEAKNWKIEGQKRRTTRKEYRKLLNEFEWEGFMAQKGVESRQRQILQDRDALPNEESDVIVALLENLDKRESHLALLLPTS